MKLNDAYAIAIEVIGHFEKHFLEWKICGSIRRRKDDVNDIDIVAVQKTNYEFGESTLEQDVIKLDPAGESFAKQMGKSGVKRFLNGPSIKRFIYKEIIIDLYIATPDNYSCLCLIRTGSTQHNIRLTTLAKGKGLKLFAGGEGLCRTNGLQGKEEKILEKIEIEEDKILMYLLNKIPTPEERN